jgi:hypothetical protein
MQVLARLVLAVPFLFAISLSTAADAPPMTAPLVTVSQGAGSANVHRIGNDNGGSVAGYAQAVARLRQQSTLVVFDGRCASACTMYLSLQNSRTCLMPGSSFLFHSAYGARPNLNRWATEYMMSQYPAWVQSWIRSQGGLTSRILRMDYAYASRFMRTCRVSST